VKSQTSKKDNIGVGVSVRRWWRPDQKSSTFSLKSSMFSLKLETLDALICISCVNIPVENINWNAVMFVWRNMQDRRVHPLL